MSKQVPLVQKSDQGFKICFFSAKSYNVQSFNETLQNSFSKYQNQIRMVFIEDLLSEKSVHMAENFDAVCVFVNDILTKNVLNSLHAFGIKLIVLRCAGFNQVDLEQAKKNNMLVVRVPSYSPYAVAEHAMSLLQTINRKIHKAFNRVREMNFSLEGLLGVDLHGKTVGLIGTGKIGLCFAAICKGFGMNILGYDPYPNKEFTDVHGGKYVEMDELYKKSDIISLHSPLLPETKYIINKDSISKMKDGVLLINTGRGGLINTNDAIEALKSKKIGGLGLDVYEREEFLFFNDLSQEILNDEVLMKLLSFPNVILTGHQAFFTKEALSNIATTTLENVIEYIETKACKNQV